MADIDYVAMAEADLDTVLAIEQAVQPDPWTRGHFLDSLKGGHAALSMRDREGMAGYAVVMPLPDEAELLNIAIAPARQRRGLGRQLLRHVCDEAKATGKQRMFLEVRRSNAPARALYEAEGFAEVGMRRDYYSLGDGRREDAILMARDL